MCNSGLSLNLHPLAEGVGVGWGGSVAVELGGKHQVDNLNVKFKVDGNVVLMFKMIKCGSEANRP